MHKSCNRNLLHKAGSGKRAPMDFSQKLQTLRKQRGLTQEGLAESLFVSRTAISKWESGRGYPSIDSLKALADFFSVTIDDLLSCDPLPAVGENNKEQSTPLFNSLLSGLLDISTASFFLIPVFAQRTDGIIQEVQLSGLVGIALYTKVAYYAIVVGMILSGILALSLRNCGHSLWIRNRARISLAVTATAALLFIAGLQPYAAAIMFVFLAIKVWCLVKLR